MNILKQPIKTKKYITIKTLNDHFDKDQIKSLEKVENLDEYYFINDFDDKELKSKIFKLKLAHLSNIIDKKIFKQIFGHTLEALANKLIDTTNKKENQIIVKNINANKKKVNEQEKTTPYNWVIQPSYQRINLKKAINLILDFNEDQLDLV